MITSRNGEDALRAVLGEKPDLVVFDIMLPGFSGIDVLKRLKYQEQTRKTPVMMLTAKSEGMDRALGFELGAEDYVTKPFSVRELVLRTRAMLARLKAPSEPPQLMRCGGILLDLSGHTVVGYRGPCLGRTRSSDQVGPEKLHLFAIGCGIPGR